MGQISSLPLKLPKYRVSTEQYKSPYHAKKVDTTTRSSITARPVHLHTYYLLTRPKSLP